jgi:DNA invertase Pin-like site-specific DNA recombinase
MTTAYAYTRFSTPAQAEGDSLRRQTAAADRYCAQHGLTLDTELNMTDLGVSAYRGSNRAKGALGAFLKALRDDLVEPGSYLLVEDIDRLTRQGGMEAIQLIGEITAAGVAVIELGTGMRYDAEAMQGLPGPLLALVKGYLGKEESRKKGERVAAAWAAKRTDAARGKLLTRVVPGWITAASGRPKLIPERAKVVRQIFDMFLAGAGKETIAAALRKLAVPTFGKAEFWRRSYVAKILESPAAMGTLIPHTDDGETRAPQAPLEGYYPAVVDAETFGRVQDLLSGSRGSGRPETGIQNILARLAVCPKCGRTMTRVMKGSAKRGGEPKLVCTGAKHGKCPYVSVSLSAVTAAIRRAAASPLPRAANLDTEIQSAAAGLEAIDEAVEELLQAIEQGHSQLLLDRLKAREAMRERAAATLAELEQRAAKADTKLLKLRTARYRETMTAEPLDIPKANAALRELVSRVVVDYEQGVLRVTWRHDGVTDIDYEPLKEIP